MRKFLVVLSLLCSTVVFAAKQPGWFSVTDDILMLDSVTTIYNPNTKEIYRFEGWVYYKSLNQYRNFVIACNTAGYYRDEVNGQTMTVQNTITPVDPLWRIKNLYCVR